MTLSNLLSLTILQGADCTVGENQTSEKGDPRRKREQSIPAQEGHVAPILIS